MMDEKNTNSGGNQEHIPPETPQRREFRIDMPAKKPLVSNIILGITIAFFLLQYASEALYGYDYLFLFLGKINEAIMVGQFWRFFTPMFLHGDILHIAFNMYALYVFGRNLEYQYGHTRFLLLYIVSAFAGNVVSFVLSPSPSLGASTAIFGLVAAQLIFVYRNKKFYGSRGQSILMNTVMILGINLLLGLSPQIDNWGHLGGMLGGLVYAWTAGPVWKIIDDVDDPRIEDQQSKMNTYTGAAIVIAAFAILAFVRWI